MAARVLSRFVDRGAVIAAFVGIGMAVTIGVSFLLVIPIEPVYWILALPDRASDRLLRERLGPASDAAAWRRLLANALFAGVVTGLTLAALLLGVKALFFVADDGYRDPGLGGSDLVYLRRRLRVPAIPRDAARGARERGRHRCRDLLGLLLGPAVVHCRVAAAARDRLSPWPAA